MIYNINNNPKPILICGPTASGKSALGIELALKTNGIIVNADALQVYDTWRILTARPSIEDEKLAQHELYGHIPLTDTYSVGSWLRDLTPILENTDRQIIILGGTGLYFTALTSGLAVIPETPEDIRKRGNEIRNRSNVIEFIKYLSTNDPDTLAKTDQMNAMRLQRAWEVFEHTGKGLSAWQDDTPAPLLPLEHTIPLVLNSNPEWLNKRIALRFDQMVEVGALDECRAVLEKGWNPELPSSRALGARELISYLNGEYSLKEAKDFATIATRQFAKRQRTWFRNKMQDWNQISLDDDINVSELAEKTLRM